MAKLVVTYTLDIDGGDLPDEAVAEYLKRAEDDASDYNLWEVAQNTSEGAPRLVSVEVATK